MEVAMVDIVLTKFGDTLRIDDSHLTNGLLPIPTGIAPEAVGRHTGCGYCILIFLISEGYHALACEKCNLRAPFPATIKTVRELKEYFALQISGA